MGIDMAGTINQPMGPREWFLLLTLSVLWGGSFFFVDVIVHSLPPLTIVLLRVGLAAIALHIVVVAAGQRMPWDGRLWRNFAAMGCLNNLIPFCLIVWGQTQIGGGLASILNATTPIFTVLATHRFTADETLTRGRGLGVVLGFSGVVVLIGVDTLYGAKAKGFTQIAVLGGALSYAVAGIYGRRFHRLNVPPIQTATGQLTASVVLLLPVVLFFEQPWTLATPSAAAFGAVAGLALLSTALAYVLYFRILATAGATNLLLVTFLIPVSAISLGALLLGERLEWFHFGGMSLIGAGLLAIDGRIAVRVRHTMS
jgi:drug/metabolite transporter (DMT)-like permease